MVMILLLDFELTILFREMITYHNINGEIIDAAEAVIQIGDVGLLRGYGIFDFFPVRNGRPLFEADYFDRFYRSAKLMSIPVGIEKDELHDRVVHLVRLNKAPRSYVKLVLTGGTSSDGFTPAGKNLFILQHPDVTYNELDYENGITLLLQNHGREHPEIKTLNYANVLQHQGILKENGALDILYHDGRYVHETSRANFFIVNSKDQLHTSKDTALGGITRKHVIKVARMAGIEVIEDTLPLHAIISASEAFITSTTKSVLPVTRVNDFIIGKGKAGEISRKLHQLFVAYMDECTAQVNDTV